MVTQKKTISGLIWVFAGTAGQNLLQFISILVLARLISPAEFGVVSAAMILIGLIQIFSDMGVGPAMVQFRELDDTHVGTGKTLSALFGIVMGMIVYLSAGYYEAFMGIEGVKGAIQLLSLALPIAGLTIVSQALLQRELHFKRLMKFIFLSHVVGQLVVAVPMALLGFGYKSLIYAVLAQNLCLMVLVNVGQRFVGYQFDIGVAKKILNFGFGQSLGKFSNYLAGQADNLIVGKFLGAAALGFYTRAYQLLTMPVNLVGGTLDKVMFPVMARMQDENKRLASIYIELTSLLLMIFTPVTVLGVLCYDEIVYFLFGESWLPAAPILQILLAVVFFRVGYKVSDALSRAKGSVYRRAWRQALYAAAVATGSYIGHFYGVEGVAIGVVLAITFNYLIMLQLSYRLIQFNMLKLGIVFAKNFFIFLLCLILVWAIKYNFMVGSLSIARSVINIVVCSGIGMLFCTLSWLTLYKLYDRELLLLKRVFDSVRRKV